MPTSFRARSFRRSPVSPGLFLASAVLLLLGSGAGCARSEAPPPPIEAKVDGHWLQPLAHGSQLVPCGHGHHAWVWSPNRAGFWLVDAEGRESVIEGLGDAFGQTPAPGSVCPQDVGTDPTASSNWP